MPWWHFYYNFFFCNQHFGNQYDPYTDFEWFVIDKIDKLLRRNHKIFINLKLNLFGPNFSYLKTVQAASRDLFDKNNFFFAQNQFFPQKKNNIWKSLFLLVFFFIFTFHNSTSWILIWMNFHVNVDAVVQCNLMKVPEHPFNIWTTIKNIE